MDRDTILNELTHIREHLYVVEDTLTGLLTDEDLVRKESPLGELLDHLREQITNAEVELSSLRLQLREAADGTAD